MLLVRIAETGEDKRFPNARPEYADGTLKVIAADGTELEEFRKDEIRGFSQCPDGDD